VFLAAPDFDAVLRWRLLQEERLAEQRAGSAIMDEAGIAAFLQYFERITRENLACMPRLADAILELDRDHRCIAHHFRDGDRSPLPATPGSASAAAARRQP
jgi:D-glycerate 3-kinase